MTRHERAFRALLAKDREAAVRAYFQAAIEEWLQDGPDEVIRILTFWATRENGEPRISMDQNTLVEVYLAKTDLDAPNIEPGRRWAVYSGPPGAEPSRLWSRNLTRQTAHEDAHQATEYWIQDRVRPRTGHEHHTNKLPVYGYDEIEGQGGWKIYESGEKLVMTFEVVEEPLGA